MRSGDASCAGGRMPPGRFAENVRCWRGAGRTPFPLPEAYGIWGAMTAGERDRGTER